MVGLTVTMTPAFFDSKHMLLRTQLNCLSKQTCKDFNVLLVDPHYKSRKRIIPELAEHYGIDILHMPYKPATHVSKTIDCAIFNTGMLMSNSDRNVRYSCYRFLRPNFVESIYSAPKNINMEFYSLNVGPDIYEQQMLDEEWKKYEDNGIILNKQQKQEVRVKIYQKHKEVWNFESDEVNWNKIPDQNGNGIMSLKRWGNPGMPGGMQDSDDLPPKGTDIVNVSTDFYGNIMWWRNNWLSINGVNEVLFNNLHWEDLEFSARAAVAGQKAMRRTHIMYRLFHFYGEYSQRSNKEVDYPLTKRCIKCNDIWDNKTRVGPGFKGLIDSYRVRINIDATRIVRDNLCYIYCNDCKCILPDVDKEDDFISSIFNHKITKAPINVIGMGRNLNILADDLDKLTSWDDKVNVFNESWNKKRYLSE